MNPIVDKIQKLLSLANSSNEHEAALAAKKAQALLLKYNLSASEIEDQDDYTQTEVDSGKGRIEPEFLFVVPVLKEHFFVRIVREKNQSNKWSYVYIGKPENVKIALYVGDFLKRSFKEQWEAYRKETSSPATSKKAFLNGVKDGLLDQLKSGVTENQAEGLVLASQAALDRELKNRFSRLSSAKIGMRPDSEAQNQGYNVGLNLRIRAGLSDTKARGLMIGGRK